MHQAKAMIVCSQVDLRSCRMTPALAAQESGSSPGFRGRAGLTLPDNAQLWLACVHS